MKFVAYFRVSTQRQGVSGLSLEAQQRSTQQYAALRGDVIAEFTEVESGKKNKRPQLQAAMELCKETGAVLLVAKLDRLSRNASFTMALKNSRLEFVACDMPDANVMTIGIMAILAEQDNRTRSERQKDQYASKRARGLGHTFGHAANFTAETRALGPAKRRSEAQNSQANRTAWTLCSMLFEKNMTLDVIAKTLNDGGFTTPKGAKFSRASVQRLKKLYV